MRKFGAILLFGCITLTIFAQEPELLLSDKLAFQKQSQFLKKSTFVENQNHGLTDFIYQQLKWHIDPDTLYIKGEVTTHFISKIQNLNAIEFDLDVEMRIDSVVYRKQNISFSQIQDKLIIPFSKSLNEGQTDSVSVYYQGTPNQSGFGSFSKTMHGDTPIIWTLSEPYGAMKWWPCKQSLVDKIDSIDIIVTSPELYRTASIGVLVSEKTENENRTMHWKHRFPIATYLVAIAVTNFVDYSDYLELDNGRKIEILNYVYPENLESAKTKTPVTTEIMDLFNALIGEYPFANEKYGHAQFGYGGGMEHQTMSFMNNFEFGLISHELAHQWFGDYITLGTWQDIWLNEGFASYLTGLSYEHLLDGFWWPRWKRLAVEKITSEPGGSVFVQDTTDISRLFSSRLSYSKGAYLLHMLRWIVGDEDFYSGIRNYYNDPEIANGFAHTNQFIEHMENAADTSLTEFFNDWFYGEGFPIYSAKYSSSETNKLTISLSQNPSHPSVDFFEMPVQVRLYNSGKTDSIDYRLGHTENNQEFVIESGFKVGEIKIDPDYWLVSKTEQIVNVPVLPTSKELIIYPNPFTESISILTPDNQNIVSTKLYSANGNLVNETVGDNKILNLINIPKGSYYIQVETTGKTYQHKLIKH